jgi:hypothetical protein
MAGLPVVGGAVARDHPHRRRAQYGTRMTHSIRLTLPARTRFVAVALLGCAATRPVVATEPARDALTWQGATTTVASNPVDDGRRRYTFQHTATDARVRERVVEEAAGMSRLRTASPMFDGLYALALTEMIEDRVEEIQDGQFNDGHPIPCRCFETGAKWPYVWTRDISYSVDLALALLDPVRSRDSLLFKQSALRPALVSDSLHPARVVAQDTGSGGSWPVSTDRVVWIHAATDVVDALGSDGASLQAYVLRIAADTLAQDRRYSFDTRAGLYRGETSFLDWREQNYPAWTKSDTRFIAEGFSLSTNVLHYVALRDAARLARPLRPADALAFEAQAQALKAAINARFWVARDGMYASYLSRDLAPAYAYDLLGLSLALIHGIADPARARSILARYPSSPAGPPVIWPEQPDTAIYHNRALWPFVTAYALRAAASQRDPLHMTSYAESLLRGSALSLSNYENHEFLTQSTAFADGPLSGPVINSPRQLWSVAGYAGMVARDLFGVRVGPGGALTIAPALPGGLARQLTGTGGSISLDQLEVAGHRVDIVLTAPISWRDTDLLEAATVAADGVMLAAGQPVPAHAARLRIQLRAVAGQPVAVRHIGAADPRRLTELEHRTLYAPPPPALAIDGGMATAAGVAPSNGWQLYRDGLQIGAVDGAGAQPTSADPAFSHCYVATQSWPGSGHRSLPSQELCVGAVRAYGVDVMSSPDGQVQELDAGSGYYRDWGGPSQRLVFTDVAPQDGLQRLTLRYSNGYGPVNTGVTAAVKEITATCPSQLTPQRGTVVMPHLADAQRVDVSTAFAYTARRGERCEFVISDGLNMSYLEHFSLYTAGRGGRSGPWNRANVRGATIVSIGTSPATRKTHVHPG